MKASSLKKYTFENFCKLFYIFQKPYHEFLTTFHTSATVKCVDEMRYLVFNVRRQPYH